MFEIEKAELVEQIFFFGGLGVAFGIIFLVTSSSPLAGHDNQKLSPKITFDTQEVQETFRPKRFHERNQEVKTCPDFSREVRDGICQGTTNIEECLFDGGDCCRPDNEVVYNTSRKGSVTCKGIGVDRTKVADAIKRATRFDKSKLLHDNPKIRFSDVASIEICTHLCLKYDWLEGWTFHENRRNEKTNVCDCWQFRQCRQNEIKPLMLDDDSSTTFALVDKMMKCAPEACFWKDTGFENSYESLIHSIPNPESCQTKCQESSDDLDLENCDYFTWISGENSTKSNSSTDVCYLISRRSGSFVNLKGVISGPKFCDEEN